MSIIWNSRIYIVVPDVSKDIANQVAYNETGNEGEYNTFSIPLYTINNPIPSHWGCSTICYAARRQRLQEQLAGIPGIKYLTIDEDTQEILATNISTEGYLPGLSWKFLLEKLNLFTEYTEE